jgi:hypothetical protein
VSGLTSVQAGSPRLIVHIAHATARPLNLSLERLVSPLERLARRVCVVRVLQPPVCVLHAASLSLARLASPPIGEHVLGRSRLQELAGDHDFERSIDCLRTRDIYYETHH